MVEARHPCQHRGADSRTHGGKGDSRRTLRACRMLEADRDPMIVKAASWALRELA
jgi:hypothetical protein